MLYPYRELAITSKLHECCGREFAAKLDEFGYSIIVETTSWIDWWTFAAKSMALNGLKDSKILSHLLIVAGARCLLLVAKTTPTLSASLILKCRDVVSTKVKDNIFESFMDLRNAPLSGSSEFFPKDAVEKAIEKSVRVLHNEAIKKSLSLDKPAKKSTMWMTVFSVLAAAPICQAFHSPILREVIWSRCIFGSIIWREGFFLLLQAWEE